MWARCEARVSHGRVGGGLKKRSVHLETRTEDHSGDRRSGILMSRKVH